MVLGMTLSVFTAVHVAISLIGIGSGIIVVLGMLGSARLPILTALFLVTTVLTSVTGFFFPYHGTTPAIIVGILSLFVLLPAILALYSFRLAGTWRWVYAVCSIVALYLNFFVLIVQLFQNVAMLKELAPTQSEPPFLIAQFAVLAIFLVLGVFVVRKFHPVVVVLA